MGRSNGAEGLAYRTLADPGRDARDLFGFVGAWAPPGPAVSAGWGAWEGDRLVGALLLERAGDAAMLYGPVVVVPDADDPETLFDIAAGLLEPALSLSEAQGIDTLYTRPQGLDRIWVRAGFIPIPEADLPGALRGRPGLGLFGWRGGTAIWSMAGRAEAARRGERVPEGARAPRSSGARRRR
ncbi:MAG TPA: hypothetical protein VFX14_08325 [Methylomirabilota bacterium]|nr:hypothetical protein [Methylomirabilota bacterium]